MNAASGPIIGHRLSHRQLHQCTRYLAATRLAAETVSGGFFIAAPFLPKSVKTLLLVTDGHVVLLSASRSSSHVSHTAVRRSDCRIAADSASTPHSSADEASYPLTLVINGHERTIIVCQKDRPLIQCLLTEQPVAGRRTSTAEGPWLYGATAARSVAAWLKASTYAQAAGAAAVILAGVLAAVLAMDQSEVLRRSFHDYVHAVNNSRPDDAFRFLTPYSRQHLDRTRWQAKFSGRTHSYATQIEDIRLSDDGLTAKVVTRISHQDAGQKGAVQTWKKLEGSWYRAYLEDIPDMTSFNDPQDRRNKPGGLLGAR